MNSRGRSFGSALFALEAFPKALRAFTFWSIRLDAAGLNPSTSGACQGTHISRTKLFAKGARKLWCRNRRCAPMWLYALTCTVDGFGRSHAIDATAPIAKERD